MVALRQLLIFGALAAWVAPAWPTPAVAAPAGRGIVVERLRRGSTGDLAGLAPGDVLVSWSRAAQPAGDVGAFSTPFDLIDVFVEELPRGPVVLAGNRGRRARSWTLPGGWPSAWQEVQAFPVRPGAPGADLARLRRRLAGRSPLAAAPLLEPAAIGAAKRGEVELAAWLRFRQAELYAKAERGEEADAAYERALAPLAGLPAASSAAAHLLRRWGQALFERNVWMRADDCYRRALALDPPESLAAAWSLTGRAYTADLSEGSTPAEELYRQALALRERLAPGSSDVAASWFDLFRHLRRQDPKAALERLRTAIEIEQKAAPDSVYVAGKLATLGINEWAAGELETARGHLERALALTESRSAEDENLPYVFQGLGMIDATEGRLPAAVGRLRRAASLAARIAPSSFEEADMLHDLGLVERRAGDFAASARHLCRALDYPEHRYGVVRHNEEETARLGFAFGDYYRDCTLALARAGRLRQAIATLERGRARAFLNLLAARAHHPPSLSPDAERRSLAAEHDRVRAALEGLDPGRDGAEIRRLEGRLREIGRRRQELAAVGSGAGRLSRLRDPRPLDLSGIRRTLDRGTVLAEFAVGAEESWLFVVRPASVGGAPVAAFPLAVGRAELERRIAVLRRLLADEEADRGALLAQAEGLYDLLLRPAEPLLAAGERLLISPDGPLHTLPFAALRHGGRFLIEDTPLHFVVSATAYGEIRRARHARGAPERAVLAAFGDPDYPELAAPAAGAASAGGSASGLRAAVRRGLARLPGSRREVLGIAALFPGARVYLGPEATEERARSVGRDVRYLHFAVHGLLDESWPFDSALALSLPGPAVAGRENGLLQLWEILDKLRLDADLVTLSACDTALGRDRGGEGLIGFTRAFQLAGAQSVLAALWSIPDETTATLMERLYRGLRGGARKDQALRAAQIEQIRAAGSGGTGSWAAFQLYGDWR